MDKPSLAALLKKSFISWDFTVAFQQDLLHIGMPIPRRFLFLGDSGNRGMAISYSLEIGETKSYFLGFRGISGIVFPLDEQSLVHNQHYTLHSFMFYQQHVIEMSTC